jgi:hypothetical protein
MLPVDSVLAVTIAVIPAKSQNPVISIRYKRTAEAGLKPVLSADRHYSITSGAAFGSKGFVLMAKEKR